MQTTPLNAFDALAKHPKLSDLVAVTRTVVSFAADARRSSVADIARTKVRSVELGLSHEDAATPFGNAIDVLGRGPEDDAERSLACALWAHVIAEDFGKAQDHDKLATDSLWLATHTPFDALGLVDRALGEDAVDLWDAICTRVRKIAERKQVTLGRAEAIIGCAALALSTWSGAQEQCDQLAEGLNDAAMVRVLRRSHVDTREEPIAAAEPTRIEPTAPIPGELEPAPRSVFVTMVLAVGVVVSPAGRNADFRKRRTNPRQDGALGACLVGEESRNRARWARSRHA